MKLLILLSMISVSIAQSDSLITEFLYKIQETVNNGDPGFFDKAYNKEKMLKRGLYPFEMESQKFNKLLSGFNKSFTISSSIVNSIKTSDDGHYVVNVYDNSADTITAVFRLAGNGLNYHKHYIIYENGKFEIIDTYVYLSGELMSETIGNLLKPMLLKDKSFVSKIKHLGSKLFGDIKAYEQSAKLMGDISRLNKQGKYQEALDKYYKLDDNFKYKKAPMILAMMAAVNCDTTKYKSLISSYESFYPNDISLNLITLDRYILNSEYSRAIQNIENIQGYIENDGYLNHLKGNIFYAAGDLENFEKEQKIAIKKESWYSMSYMSLLEFYITGKRYKDAVEIMSLIKENLGLEYTRESMSSEELFSDFLKSNEFKNWEKQ